MSELADALMQDAPTTDAAVEIPHDSGHQDEPSGAERPGKTTSAPEKPLSLRDQINKSVEAVRTEEAKRVRDAATGKFTTKTEASAAEKPAAAEIPTTEQNASAAASKPAGPPSGWSKEAQALWETLPPSVKADAVRREAEVAKGFEEYRGKTAQLQEISQALDPIRPVLQQNGITSDAHAVKTLLNWEAGFRNPQTRMQAFHQLAQQYGVDLRSLVQSQPSPSTAQDIPEPLRPVIDQFGNSVQEVRKDVNAVQQELQTLRSERIETELRSFAKDKPHFDKVRVLMGQLMSSGAVPAGDLDTAYQKATLIHPEVSAAIEAERVAKTQAELAKTNAEKAARARQAAVSPAPRSPTGAANGAAAQKSQKASVRDSILSSVAELREGQRA
jgi:DNA repair exonuclease SbcCD ATPase subunit